jgi:hypothetical protein
VKEVMDIAAPDDDVQGAQLYLANQLTRSLTSIPFRADQFEDWYSELSGYGVEVGYNSTHYSDYYNNGFLLQILEEELGGYWADEAVLWTLSSGRNIYYDTEEPAQFLQIIPDAEQYLDRHPDTHIRESLLHILARAHETGWSVSQSGENDPYVESERFLPDAEYYRDRAIHHYQSLLDEFPDIPGREAIEIRLRWLMMGLDTNTRAYYYFLD